MTYHLFYLHTKKLQHFNHVGISIRIGFRIFGGVVSSSTVFGVGTCGRGTHQENGYCVADNNGEDFFSSIFQQIEGFFKSIFGN